MEKRMEEIRAAASRELEMVKAEARQIQQQAQVHGARLEEMVRKLTGEIEMKDRENGAARLRIMD